MIYYITINEQEDLDRLTLYISISLGSVRVWDMVPALGGVYAVIIMDGDY